MAKTFIFFILSAVLLLKQSLGETENTSTTKELTTNGRVLYNEVIAKFAATSEVSLKLAKKLCEDSSHDISNNMDFTRLLDNVLKDFEKVLNEKSKIVWFLKFNNLFHVLSRPINEDDLRKGELLLAVKETFEKHDLKSVTNEFQQKFDEFLNWLKQEFHERSDSLTLEDWLRVKTLKELCLQFKDETDVVKKKHAMSEIIKSFEY